MKKLLLFTVAFMFINIISYAQNFGIKAGINFANAHCEVLGTAVTANNLTRFQAGIIGEFNLYESFFFNTGLMFSQKGFKVSSILIGSEITKCIFNYFDIPLNFAYKYDIGGANIFAQGGPYAGIGLSAKEKTGDKVLDREFGGGNDQLKRLDIGLNFGGGVEIDAIKLSINYGIGLVDLENEGFVEMKNRVFSITAGYLFGK